MNTAKPRPHPRPSATSATDSPRSTTASARRRAAGAAIKNQQAEIVLLAVTGMSPAVLTETVWALAHETPPRIPDRVIVITTIAGRQAIERELLLDPSGREAESLWQQLRRALLRDGFRDDPRLLIEPCRVITAPNPRIGRADWLEDIRTQPENAAVADFILEQVRAVVEKPDTRLIASLAGGRKTMGALLYAALTLLGRETDRLTHVLVNEPFDDPRLKPRFYFPGQAAATLALPDGRQIAAADARIELADAPFVPLRNLFERELIKKPSSFNALVARCRNRVEELASAGLRIELWRSRPEIRVNSVTLRLSPLQHVLLLFLGEQTAGNRGGFDKYANAIEPLRAFGEKQHAARDRNNFSDWRDHARLPADFDDQRLRKLLDEIKTKLRAAGPDTAPLIARLPQKGRFALDLPARAIHIRA